MADLSRVYSIALSSSRYIFSLLSFRDSRRINVGDFSFAGREESDTDDELLGDTDLDGPSPEMERLGVRGDPSDSCSLQSRLEAGHDPLQQVSDDCFDRKEKLLEYWHRRNENGKGELDIFGLRSIIRIEVSISITPAEAFLP